MQRQSLGSPGSKLHANGVVLVKEDAHNIPSSSTSELSPQKPFSIADDDDGEEDKLQKKLQRPHDKFIHLIPVLTLFCILILYLSSHTPSQTELAGFKHLSKPRGDAVDSLNIDEIQRVLEIEKGEILGIRSMRNLQEVYKKIPKYRLNRKIGDF